VTTSSLVKWHQIVAGTCVVFFRVEASSVKKKKKKKQVTQKHLPYFLAHKTHFFPKKCDLNSICVLCAEGKYYFQTYKYPYIYYTTSLS